MAPPPGDGAATGRIRSGLATVAGSLLPVLVAQALAFALLAGSGKMPPLVLRAFRALLTL